jgi:alpha-beta hydrolase superfamily lysophospholipase
MKHEEGWLSAVRGQRNYYQYWLPDTDPKAALLLVHGLAEHSGRYADLARHFVALGHAVYGIDHVGHGRSGGARAYVQRFQDFLTPLETFLDMVSRWQPGKPVFLAGHSMGGLIAAACLLERQDDMDGAILSGPSIKVPENISPAVVMAARLLSALAPGIGVARLDASGVSRDPAVVKAYVEDPLVYTGRISARLGAELLKAMQRINAEANRIRLPVLILQGGADRLVDPDGARMLHDLVGSVDKTLKVYPGLYHEVYNEPERTVVLHDVQSWIESRLPRPSDRPAGPA